MKTLIVDDSSTIRNILTDILSPFGISDTARDGLEGFGLFKKAWQQNEPYDLVCLDIEMPELNGHEVLRLIRSWELDNGIKEDKKLKILMVTSHKDPRNMLDAFKEFCDDYIIKPLAADKILFKLRRLELID